MDLENKEKDWERKCQQQRQVIIHFDWLFKCITGNQNSVSLTLNSDSFRFICHSFQLFPFQNTEKEAYEKRQKVLSDLQKLKDRENQLEKNNELALK